MLYTLFPLRGKHVCFPAEFYPYAMHSARPSACIFIATKQRRLRLETMEGWMWVRIWWKANKNRSYSSLNRIYFVWAQSYKLSVFSLTAISGSLNLFQQADILCSFVSLSRHTLMRRIWIARIICVRPLKTHYYIRMPV